MNNLWLCTGQIKVSKITWGVCVGGGGGEEGGEEGRPSDPYTFMKPGP